MTQLARRVVRLPQSLIRRRCAAAVWAGLVAILFAGAAVQAEPSHWSFRRPAKPPVPAVRDEAWGREPIDRFVLAELEARGLAPSPRAEPRALLRRLAYDLTGLPPTAEQLDAFAADPSPAAYAAAVEQWLAAPAFGERWGRHWLDVARYADSKGYVFQEDRNYPGAYRYRDWVIRSFNEDLPYDAFVVAQLAADQTADAEDAAAIGFLTLGRRFLNNRHDIIDDRIDLVTRGLMGLSVACARCHDHMYDPIPAADYYALYGVFDSAVETPRDDLPPQLADADKPTEPVVFLRGSPGNRGPAVSRRFLTCLSTGEPAPFARGSGRLELAEAIASADNPLTARVWVNRVWTRLWGQGLVATASDFGTRGEPPTHPELLDWLATQFMEEGWSTKKLIRQLVLSHAYCQASDVRPEAQAVDPENRWLWRAPRRRLDLEAYRDSLLVASGQLDLALGGPAVDLFAEPPPPRRTVYGYVERQNLPEFFRTFDFANPNTHAGQRPETLTPQQALYALNSPFVLAQSAALADRTAKVLAGGDASTPPDEAQRVERLYRYALGRSPAADEAAEALAYLRGATDGGAEPSAAWAQLAQALLMSNEFMFLD